MSRIEKATVNAQKVREAMRAAALSPTAVAASAGFSVAQVARAVHGKPISLAAVRRLAKALKLRPTDLLEAEPSAAVPAGA